MSHAARTGTPLIIAEAGVNHNGDMALAHKLIDAAAKARADMIKFQAFRAEDLVAGKTAAANYQAAHTGIADQRELLRGLQLDLDAFARLAEHCRKRNISFLCTPFDVAATAELVALGMPCIKVASSELTNTPALEHFAGFGLPVLLSTGMATLDEVSASLAILEGAGARDVTLLHCTSLYPAPIETINLRAMITMREKFGRPVGYSDHSLGDHVVIAAVALGATIIEKHFTLDRNLPGPDHAVSLEPDEFAQMSGRLRETATALGDGIKGPATGEAETAQLVRRSWHAARDLAAGTVLSNDDLALKRPADGLAPRDTPVGRRLASARPADEPIREQDLDGGETT